MDTDELRQAVREIIARELDRPSDSLAYEGSLRRDYGFDSVAAINVLFSLETSFGVEIDVSHIARVDSIEEIANTLHRLLPKS